MTLQSTCINLNPGDCSLQSLIMLLQNWDPGFMWAFTISHFPLMWIRN
jgi:hypothetical protein